MGQVLTTACQNINELPCIVDMLESILYLTPPVGKKLHVQLRQVIQTIHWWYVHDIYPYTLYTSLFRNNCYVTNTQTPHSPILKHFIISIEDIEVLSYIKRWSGKYNGPSMHYAVMCCILLAVLLKYLRINILFKPVQICKYVFVSYMYK